jgi:hypothetical protein
MAVNQRRSNPPSHRFQPLPDTIPIHLGHRSEINRTSFRTLPDTIPILSPKLSGISPEHRPI